MIQVCVNVLIMKSYYIRLMCTCASLEFLDQTIMIIDKPTTNNRTL